MPIELTWILPDHILLSRWTGSVTPDDIHILNDELFVVFNYATRPIHTIIDLFDVVHVEEGIVATYLGSPLYAAPQHGQIAVTYLTDALAPMVEQINAAAQRELIHVCKDRASAQSYLLELDTVQDQPPES